SGCTSQHWPELPNAKRTESAHIPRTKLGVAHDHIDRIEGDVEFVGSKLRQRGLRPLSQFHLANETSDLAIAADTKIGIEIGRVAGAARQMRRFLERGHRIRGEEDEEPSARELQELTPTGSSDHIGSDLGSFVPIVCVHQATPSTEPATSRMASTIRV